MAKYSDPLDQAAANEEAFTQASIEAARKRKRAGSYHLRAAATTAKTRLRNLTGSAPAESASRIGNDGRLQKEGMGNDRTTSKTR